MSDITNILEEIKSLNRFLQLERKKLEKNLNEIDKSIKRDSFEYTKIQTDLYKIKYTEVHWDIVLKISNRLLEIFPTLSEDDRVKIWDIMIKSSSLQNFMFWVYDKNSKLDYTTLYKLGLLKFAIVNFIDIDEYYGCLLDYVEDAKKHSIDYKPIFKEISQYADYRTYFGYIEISGRDMFLVIAGEKPNPFDY